jgi:hypothetical protein
LGPSAIFIAIFSQKYVLARILNDLGAQTQADQHLDDEAQAHNGRPFDLLKALARIGAGFPQQRSGKI